MPASEEVLEVYGHSRAVIPRFFENALVSRVNCRIHIRIDRATSLAPHDMAC